MGELKCEAKKNNDKIMIKFSGAIDEDCSLPKVDLKGIKELLFDFSGLTLINSCGIRDWVSWMKTIPATTKTVFTNCPSILVDQVNMINGFIPEGGYVQSFFVPYFCDECDDVVNKLVERGKDYNKEDCKVKDEIKCPKCDATAELDVIKLKYFKFLKTFG